MLSDFYTTIGCSKQDISNWKQNPCSTHATTRALKTSIIIKVSELLGLQVSERETLANSAGFSLGGTHSKLQYALYRYHGKQCEMLGRASVSERMLQRYLSGLEPTKQALLAIAVSVGLTLVEIEALLLDYGYCLSKSLPNDAVVRWYYLGESKNGNTTNLILTINETLEYLGLPLLMTKIMNR